MSQPSNSNDAVLTALRQTLERDPANEAFWLHYIDMLSEAGRSGDALIAARAAREHVSDRWALGKKMVPLLRDTGEVSEAAARAETLLDARDDAELRLEYARLLLDQGRHAAATAEYAKARAEGLSDPELEGLTGATPVVPPSRNLVPSQPSAERERAPLGLDGWDEDVREEIEEGDPRVRASLTPDAEGEDRWAAGLDWGNLFVTFQDVAGLQDVKNQINLRIIAPFKSPEIYLAFKRTAGGGILLYGPPGCGKTFLARATAGECGARFLSVGIHEMIDQFWGQSEKLMHALFEEARRRSPTVVFFDEFDALGSQRGRTESQFWKTLVDQLLQEMDGMTGRNDDLLIFAATNVPWNVDSAFRRPGRWPFCFPGGSETAANEMNEPPDRFESDDVQLAVSAGVEDPVRALMEIGRYDLAETRLRARLAEDPTDADSQCLMGYLCEQTERTDEAIEAYEFALRQQPEYVDAMVGMGRVYYATERKDDAEAMFKAALREDPDSCEALTGYADIQRERGKSAEAEDLLNRALALDPFQPPVHFGLLQLEFVRGNVWKAMRHARKLTHGGPEEVYTHVARGLIGLCSGRPRQARESLREALRLEPDDMMEKLYQLSCAAVRPWNWPFYGLALVAFHLWRLWWSLVLIPVAFFVLIGFGFKTEAMLWSVSWCVIGAYCVWEICGALRLLGLDDDVSPYLRDPDEAPAW